MSRDGWLTLGALLVVAGVALLVGLRWLPRDRSRDRK